MILKEIPRKGEFHPWQLAEYLRKPKADALKAGLAQEWDSRVRDMFVFNFTQDEARAADPGLMMPELATNALVYTARHNGAVDDQHAYHHFVLSLAPGEHLTHGQWERTLSSVLEAGDYGNCKAYAVMHVGERSDCEHVHLVVCSIDKDTYRQHNAYKYVNKMIRAKDLMVDRLMAEGAAITRENRIDPQILTQGERLKLEAQRLGRDLKINRARTGRKITPVIERLSPPVVKKLLAARTLDEFRQVLDEAGIEMAQKGRGLIFRDKDDHANQCKASAASRSLSARSLARRFGGDEGRSQPRSAGHGGNDEILSYGSAALDDSGIQAAPPLIERAKAMRKALKKARTFAEFQEILANAGLEYAARGNGSVIRDRATGEAVKATDVDRSFSRKLLDKLFASPAPSQAGQAPRPGIIAGQRSRSGRRIVFNMRLWIITVPQLIRRAEKRGDHVSVTAEKILVNGNARTGTIWDCARAAAQRFGKGYRVFGDYSFQMRMMKAALALGHSPRFDNPAVQQQFNEALRQRSIEHERKNQLARDLALARALGREGRQQAAGGGQGQWQRGGDHAAMPDVRTVHDDAFIRDGGQRPADGDQLVGREYAGQHPTRSGGPALDRDALHDDLEGVGGRAERQGLESGKRGRLGEDASSALHGMDERRGGGGGRDLSREAASLEEEATWVPGMDAGPKTKPKPGPADPAPAPQPQPHEQSSYSHSQEFQPVQDIRTAAFVKAQTQEQADALAKAGAKPFKQENFGNVYRIAREDLRKAALPGPQPAIFGSYQALASGLAMPSEEAARLYRQAVGLGKVNGRGRDDGNSDGMGGGRGGR